MIKSFVDVKAAHQNHRVFLKSLRDDDGKVSIVFRDFIVDFFNHYENKMDTICFDRAFMDGDGDGSYMETNLYHNESDVHYFLNEYLYIQDDIVEIYDTVNDDQEDISILHDTYLRMGLTFKYHEEADVYSIKYPIINNSPAETPLDDDANHSLLEEVFEWAFDEWTCGIIHYNKDTDVLTLYVQEHPHS